MSEPQNPRDIFIHRDPSWLSFNERVLEEAEDTDNPLLERARFLAIAANNLDEFFMVRVAAVKRLIDVQYRQRDPFGYFPEELLSELGAQIDRFTGRMHGIYRDGIRPALLRHKISVRSFAEMDDEQKKAAKRYFDTTLYPIVTPMGLDPGHPFPVLFSKTNAFFVSLTRGNEPFFAIVPIPGAVPRLFKLPSGKDENHFILIDDIIHRFMDFFFKGYQVLSVTEFRVIRDSELAAVEEIGRAHV